MTSSKQLEQAKTSAPLKLRRQRRATNRLVTKLLSLPLADARGSVTPRTATVREWQEAFFSSLLSPCIR